MVAPMSDRIILSRSEVGRVGVWALRGLGYPFEIADRGAAILSRAVVAGEPALSMLRLMESDFRSSHGQPKLALARNDAGYAVDAHDRALVEAGPVAIDLVTAATRNGGWGLVTVERVFGMQMIAGLAHLALRRGLSTLMIWTAGGREVAATGMSQAGWRVTGVSTPSAGETLGGLGDALDGWPEAARSQVELARRREAQGSSFFSVVARPCADPAHRNLDAQIPPADVITADVEDFMHLYALERICWAPTSERSFQQAAF
mgnify:CR=1 FL=1